MSRSGFILSRLQTVGPGKVNAEVVFKPGLNVIAGASNTGKSYIFHSIDFLLGSSTPPEQIPESSGYTHTRLEIVAHDGQSFSFERALGGGDLRFSRSALSSSGPAQWEHLGGRHVKGDTKTISGVLLGLTGLLGKEVRRNELGEKSALSFRDVAWLTLVDEERIITKSSPLLSGQYTEKTKEQSVFGLFMTGTDDAAIIAQERAAERRARLQAELNLLGSLRADAEARWKPLGIDSSALEEQTRRVEASIEKASTVVATLQAEIDQIAERRGATWNDLQAVMSRRVFLGEQIKRLRLLQDYYQSDRARLESAGVLPIFRATEYLSPPTGSTWSRSSFSSNP